MKAQFQRCVPEIQAPPPPSQQVDDLTWLFDAIVKSPMEDVVAELKTGENYDWNYCSPLRQGRGYGGSDLRDNLDKFRKDELDSPCRNDQRIVHVYTLLEQYEDRLIAGGNYDKLILACRQILGLRQLLNCTGYDRIVFASGQINEATEGKEINRDRGYNYKYSEGSFPVFDIDLINSHSGLGFDFFVSIYALGGRGAAFAGGCCFEDFKIYVEQKHHACGTLCSNSQPKKNLSVSV